MALLAHPLALMTWKTKLNALVQKGVCILKRHMRNALRRDVITRSFQKLVVKNKKVAIGLMASADSVRVLIVMVMVQILLKPVTKAKAVYPLSASQTQNVPI